MQKTEQRRLTMRIVSENKSFDIPYERFLIGLIKIDSVVEMYARDEQGVEYILADYKTVAQAQTEMTQIRLAYKRGEKMYLMEGTK